MYTELMTVPNNQVFITETLPGGSPSHFSEFQNVWCHCFIGHSWPFFHLSEFGNKDYCMSVAISCNKLSEFTLAGPHYMYVNQSDDLQSSFSD